MPSEFELIARHFTRPSPSAVLGVGDDCALMRVADGMELAVSTDMLVAGRHFFEDVDPRDLGHKALAVNLSDIAAMGATPRWATLSLALPRADEPWIAAFAGGFFDLGARHGVDLVGGDTTRGPLNLCVTIMGEAPRGQALRRDGARAGDELWVSGELGGAALGLAHLEGRVVLEGAALGHVLGRLHRPEPRVGLGLALRGIATAALDVSDGLLGDLGHILERSAVGARVELDAVPRDAALAAPGTSAVALACLLAGGDDYELLFCAPPERAADVLAAGRAAAVPVTRIGRIVPGRDVQVLDGAGRPIDVTVRGYDHFG